jgi:hypothetical protein
MSYDISIGEDDFNITYNVGPMFYAAIPETGIRTIYGKTGRDAVSILRDMREYFEENKDALKKMEPSNGWGTYDNTYKCLCKMILSSMNNLDEKWSGD